MATVPRSRCCRSRQWHTTSPKVGVLRFVTIAPGRPLSNSASRGWPRRSGELFRLAEGDQVIRPGRSLPTTHAAVVLLGQEELGRCARRATARRPHALRGVFKSRKTAARLIAPLVAPRVRVFAIRPRTRIEKTPSRRRTRSGSVVRLCAQRRGCVKSLRYHQRRVCCRGPTCVLPVSDHGQQNSSSRPPGAFSPGGPVPMWRAGRRVCE